MEDIKELTSDDIKTPEDLDKVLQEKLGIGLREMTYALTDSLRTRAEEVAEDCFSVAPYGDYSKMIEDPEGVAKFFRDEAAKPEHWKLEFFEMKKKGDQLVEFIFTNTSVDDGDILKGYVFVGLSGTIRHAFCQAHT